MTVSVAGVFTWRSFEKHTDPSDLAKDQMATAMMPAVAPGRPAGSNAELAANDPRRSYFGVELGSGSIAYVIDDDPAMKPYIEPLARVTNLVNAADSKERHGVIVRPSGRRPSALLGFAEGADSKSDVETTLAPTLPKTRQDLTYAFGIAVGRSPDAIFLVLARSLASDEISRLAQAAEQAGTVTHVVAVGPAAKQDLSQITAAGGGMFIPLSDQQFKGQVQAYDDSEDR